MHSEHSSPNDSIPRVNPLKAPLRQRVLAARAALSPQWRRQASGLIAERVLRLIDRAAPAMQSIALYASFGEEVETHALIAKLLERRLRVALPYVIHHPRFLEMRVIDRFPEGLRLSRHGVLQPEPLACPEILSLEAIDLALIPGVAFDRRGGRLGMGAGYYDRWLATGERRGLALGLAFGEQVVDAVPVDPWDRRLDGVVTESGPVGPCFGRP
jgi:5-formyltetrahydrofolate cyclo-ligase